MTSGLLLSTKPTSDVKQKSRKWYHPIQIAKYL